MNNDTIPRSLSFLAGAAAGLALGYYLHSEKGSALRERLSGQWEGALEDLGDRVQEHLGELVTALGAALENGLEMAGSLDEAVQQNLQSVGDGARDAMEDAEETFENGMEKARARLQQKFAEAGIDSKP